MSEASVEMGQLLLALGRIEGRLAGIDIHMASQNVMIQEIEKRVSTLEKKWAWVYGVAAVIVGAIGMAGAYIKAKLIGSL